MLAFRHRIYGALAVLALATAPAEAQQVNLTITGSVRSEDDAEIQGAVIQVIGLPFATVSRGGGRYTLTIPANRITPGQTVRLQARAINYKPLAVSLTLDQDALSQDFRLAPNPLQLGEIVITGAGTESDVAKLGNVRNHVDSTAIQKSNETNIVTALAAKAPNVEVTSTSGDPGASSSIRIRGVNTLSGAGDPLFIIDGIPADTDRPQLQRGG